MTVLRSTHPTGPAGPRRSRLGRARLVAVAVAGALVLAACGGGAGGGSTEPATFDDGPVDAAGETLSVWIMEGTNPDAKPFFSDVSAAFEEETGATLDVQYVPWASAKDKFTTAIAGGETPDVAEVGSTWTGEFGEIGALSDLSAAVDEAGLGDDLNAGLVESATVGDAMYGMPWYAGVRSIVYRKDVFEKAGVTPPTTWDELVEVGEKIKASDPDIIPFPVAGGSEYGAYPWIWGAGGDVAAQAEDGTWTSTIDSAEARQGLAFYTGLATEHDLSTPAATTWDEVALSDAFIRGDSAMTINGNWSVKAITEANPDLEGKIGAFAIPGPDGGLSPSFIGGSHLDIFNTADDPDLAWAFVKMMTTGEFAEQWAASSGFFPGQTSLLDQVQSADDPLVTPFAEQFTEAGKSVPVTPLYGKIQGEATVPAMLQSILSGKKSVEEATTDAAAEMDDVFAEGSDADEGAAR